MLTTCPPLTTHYLYLNPLFDGQKDSLTLKARDNYEGCDGDLESQPIKRFVRTADGRGIGIIRANGGESWSLNGSFNELLRVGHWPDKGLLAVLNDG